MGNPSEPPPYPENVYNPQDPQTPYPQGPQAPYPQEQLGPQVQYVQGSGAPNAPSGSVVVMALQIGPVPVMVTCQACGYQGLTRTATEPSSKTHLMALGLFLVGCWCCCCIPYYVDSCQNINHYCARCNAYIATYNN